MKRSNLALSLVLTGLLAACGQTKSPDSAAATSGEKVAVVNGKPITKAAFEAYVLNIERQNNGRPITAEQRGLLLDQYIGMQLAADSGEKNGVAKDPKTAEELAYARNNVLAQAALQKYLDEHPVKDDELKPFYEQEIAKLPLQYHTRHILVAEQTQANDVVKQLQGGADFAKLAGKLSLDSSKSSGGDIGWMVPDDMMKPYADAVAKLKTGEYTTTPVRTEYGWHVIRLDESKAQDYAPFEDVKDKVEMVLKRKRVQDYTESLRKEAKIEKLGPYAKASPPPAA